eukprot:2234887-Pyramimonas_sp.AAC.1
MGPPQPINGSHQSRQSSRLAAVDPSIKPIGRGGPINQADWPRWTHQSSRLAAVGSPAPREDATAYAGLRSAGGRNALRIDDTTTGVDLTPGHGFRRRRRSWRVARCRRPGRGSSGDNILKYTIQSAVHVFIGPVQPHDTHSLTLTSYLTTILCCMVTGFSSFRLYCAERCHRAMWHSQTLRGRLSDVRGSVVIGGVQ